VLSIKLHRRSTSSSARTPVAASSAIAAAVLATAQLEVFARLVIRSRSYHSAATSDRRSSSVVYAPDLRSHNFSNWPPCSLHVSITMVRSVASRGERIGSPRGPSGSGQRCERSSLDSRASVSAHPGRGACCIRGIRISRRCATRAGGECRSGLVLGWVPLPGESTPREGRWSAANIHRSTVPSVPPNRFAVRSRAAFTVPPSEVELRCLTGGRRVLSP
jgi:hypothetical protein